MTAAPTHGVLFDVGYGLCDETPRLAVALRWLSAALAPYGLRLSPQKLDQVYCRVCANPRTGAGSLIEQTIVAAGGCAALAKQVRSEMPWDAEPLALLPGALEALRALRNANLYVGVLANQPPSAANDLQRLGVAPLLDDLWLSEAVGLHKPDPAFFQLALDAWHLSPRRVAYVGDRPDHDIAPAKRLELHTVRLMVGPHARQACAGDEQCADYEAPSLADAANHLLKWMMDDG